MGTNLLLLLRSRLLQPRALSARERGTKTSTAAAYTGAAPEKNTALLQGQLQRNPRSGIPCFRRRGLNRYPRQQVLLSPCLHSRKSTPLRSARVRPPASGRSTL